MAADEQTGKATDTPITNPDTPEAWAERINATSGSPHSDTTAIDPQTYEEPWVTEEAIAALVEDKTDDPGQTDEELARKILREGSPAAASAVLHLAIHSSSESTRLRASQYVIDRTLGRPGEDLRDRGEDPLRAFLEELQVHANGGND